MRNAAWRERSNEKPAAVSQAAAFVKLSRKGGYVMKEKGNPLLQIIRNVNDAVVVVLFLAMTITVIIQDFFSVLYTESLRWSRRISEISDDMAGIDGIGDCDEKSFSPSGRCSDICTSAKAETHFDRDCRSFNDCFLMYYDIFRVQSSTVYDGSDVSGDADSDGFDLRGIPNRWSFDDYGTAPYL